VSVIAPVGAEPLGSADMDGSWDMVAALGDALAGALGTAVDPPVPLHAVKATAAAAIRTNGRIFTGELSYRRCVPASI
jgi:hypothetical protein